MKKVTVTKYCLSEDKPKRASSSSFEKRFEAYIEKKVKKIIEHPEKYPFFDIIVEE